MNAMKTLGFVANGTQLFPRSTKPSAQLRRSELIEGPVVARSRRVRRRAQDVLTMAAEGHGCPEDRKRPNVWQERVHAMKSVTIALFRSLIRSSARRKRMRYVKMAQMCMLMPVMLATVTTSPTAVGVSAGGGLWRLFTSAFGVVFVSQFGDKSMFATALMAMRHSPFTVFIGALLSLTMMSIIACFLGQVGSFLPSQVTHYASILLFAFFGLQMLLQARNLSDKPGVGSEVESAKEMVDSKPEATNRKQILAKVSSLIFVAEWLDRSMLTTMALAASGNASVVFLGASMANVICTAIAVAGAALVATRISERAVTISAGVLFEFFAIFTFFEPQFEAD